MKLIKAIIRPEKVLPVLEALSEKGHNSVTRISVLGRGKQRGLKVGDVYYDEIPKEMLLIVVEDDSVRETVQTIVGSARTEEAGAFGDGKIFVSEGATAYTVSTGEKGL